MTGKQKALRLGMVCLLCIAITYLLARLIGT